MIYRHESHKITTNNDHVLFLEAINGNNVNKWLDFMKEELKLME